MAANAIRIWQKSSLPFGYLMQRTHRMQVCMHERTNERTYGRHQDTHKNSAVLKRVKPVDKREM